MPFYFADYLADTGHLSTVEHGAYFLLIAHYWAHGKLPDDEAAIARITRMTARQWSRSRDVLRSFFDDGWFHKRIDEEIAKSLKISEVNSANAKRRHIERTAKKVRSDTQPQPQPQPHLKKVCAPVSLEFEKFRRAYPKRTGSQGWPEAQKFFDKAVKAGTAPADLIAAAQKFCESLPKDTAGTKFVPMAEKWMRKELWREFLPTEEDKRRAEETERFLAARGYGKPAE